MILILVFIYNHKNDQSYIMFYVFFKAKPKIK